LKKIFERPGLIDVEKLEAVCQSVEKEFDKKKQEEFIERCWSILRTAKVVSAIRKGVDHSVLNAKHHEKEAGIVAQAGKRSGVTVATNMAGRGTDILLGGNAEYLAKDKLTRDGADPDGEDYEAKVKELTAHFKEQIDKDHDEVIALGGLHIIGTERHEARRIDNQLRGRSGRQGDPGTSRFFLSLEDNLMRIFGGEKISKLMDFIRADEEMPIESGMVSKSIEGAQKKVEAHHFDMRKHVLQYDDVLNTQREVIYRERRRILERADLKKNMKEMMDEHLEIVMSTYLDPDSPPDMYEEQGLPEVLSTLVNDIPVLSDVQINELIGLSYDDLQAKLQESLHMAYEVREQHIGTETMREMERQILLQTIDSKWVDYLHNIDILREGIHLRGYGQRDPLQEYKREAFDMFNQLLRSIQHESIQLLFRAQPMAQMDLAQLEGMLPEELLKHDLSSLTEEQLNEIGLTRVDPSVKVEPSEPVLHDGPLHITAGMTMVPAQPADAPKKAPPQPAPLPENTGMIITGNLFSNEKPTQDLGTVIGGDPLTMGSQAATPLKEPNNGKKSDKGALKKSSDNGASPQTSDNGAAAKEPPSSPQSSASQPTSAES
jgi:preprotein translocase subunit SecA